MLGLWVFGLEILSSNLANGINQNLGYEFWKLVSIKPASGAGRGWIGLSAVFQPECRSALLSPAGYNVPLPATAVVIKAGVRFLEGSTHCQSIGNCKDLCSVQNLEDG